MRFTKRYYFFALLLYFSAIIAHLYYDYQSAKSDLTTKIDRSLLRAAHTLPLLLDTNFHFQGMNKGTVTEAQDWKNILMLSKEAKVLGVKYIYTCIRRGDTVYFTSSSGTDEELTTRDMLTHYFDTYDDASPALLSVFESNTVAYDEYSDKWGTFRSVYVPLISPDGTVYVAGADIDISFIDARLHDVLVDSLFDMLFFILIIIPFFYIYRRNVRETKQELEATIRERTALLSEREEALHLLLDSVVEGIYGVDMNGNCTFVNRSFLRILGFDHENEILGKHIHELIHHSHADGSPYPSKECRMYKAYQTNELSHADDEVFWCKDGKSVPVEYWSYPMVRNGKFVGAVATFIDISERKETERLIIAAKEAAEASAQAKSDFLAAMSHEIRTPMNGVLGMLGLLAHSRLDEAQHHQLRVAQSSATSLLGLINDILDFSKIEAGKMDLEQIEFNLLDELGSFAESIAFKAQEKGVELILDATRISHPNIITDPGRLRQVLTNLVGNSIKFTEHGHILITAQLLPQEDAQAVLRVDVTDTGIGIPQEKIDSLFEAFTQADGSTTRKYGGTGLGLSIVKRLCELMGGHVYATSTVGHGSTFTIEIRVEMGEVRDIAVPSISVEGKSVLIVDDNETNRIVVRSQLNLWGMDIHEAQSADEALHLCRQRINQGHIPPYDVALIDMQMPETDGALLGEKLRSDSDCDQMKMVMMTSLGSRHDATTFAKIGYNAFFAKPTTAKDLLNALKILFDNGEALSHAEPLITKDYLGTLKEETTHPLWPSSTRILLVEDNPTNQIVAQGMLETMGLGADVAGNGLEAIDALRLALDTAPYTLILMDCQMPEMDGFEASRAIRRAAAGDANRQIPIIAMTANAMSGDRDRCIASGMDDYIAKPINLQILKSTLMKWILHRVDTLPETQTPGSEVRENSSPAVWNPKDALRRLGGNEQLLTQIVQSLSIEGKKVLDALRTAVESNDLSAVELHAHSLKGSAANAGALALQEITAKLEAAAKRHDRLFVQEALNPLESVWKKTLESFKNSIQTAPKPKKRHDPLVLALQLQTLRQKIVAGSNPLNTKEAQFSSYADEKLTASLIQIRSFLEAGEENQALHLIDEVMSGLE